MMKVNCCYILNFLYMFFDEILGEIYHALKSVGIAASAEQKATLFRSSDKNGFPATQYNRIVKGEQYFASTW